MFNTRLFSQSATIEEFTGRDGYNVPSYGTAHAVKCREETDLVYKRENFKEFEATDTIVYVYSPAYTPQIEDKYNMLDGLSFPIKHIIRNRDDRGNVKFYTVVLGK